MQRYTAVFDHVSRILGRTMFVEAITRADIDDYKAQPATEASEQQEGRRIEAASALPTAPNLAGLT